ncbi:GDSL esterase/lipase At2g03980-like [Prosopis cineraria]|uniref:GDSL esterase/lipase At2g03980-like n=1 Tax=Prosopis cineraria TaxID=364024 RepID=UPI00240F52BA|nr:GDSL esterase/lipase At2g03980-like [Prosopis cineraria]
MENSKILLFLAFCFFLIAQQILSVKSEKHPHRLVPALYIFGSSSVDAGNNNHLNTVANANMWPYAIDFNNVRGRYSNGKNLADFAAINLGLPSAPPYLNLSDSQRSQIATGINYGSGACGILNTSRVGDCLWLGQQIKYFTSTVKNDLPKQMDETKLRNHLAKSMYLLFIGLNDYNPLANGNITDRYSGPDYADYLLDEISKHIQTLYDLGARKFVVQGVSLCKPKQYDQEKTVKGKVLNCTSRYYRDKLPAKLSSLEAKLKGSIFTIYDNYMLRYNMQQNHQKYGITEIEDPCYVSSTNELCSDRTKYHFFDKWGHQTEVSCKVAMNGCFNGTICTPYTLFQLANMHINHKQ